MPSVKQIIDDHNKTILKKESQPSLDLMIPYGRLPLDRS